MLTIRADVDRFVGEETLETGTQTFGLQLEVCSSATCGCRRVSVLRSDTAPPVWLAVDPFDRVGLPDETSSTAAASSAFAAKLDEPSWKLLHRYLVETKARQIDASVTGNETYDFPFDRVELDGALISHREVFPFAGPHLVVIDAQEYVLDDMYCVQPGCDCTNANLGLVPTAGDPTVPAPAEWEWAVDVKRDVWLDPDHEGPMPASSKAPYAALRAQHPRLLATLQNHRRQLRAMFTRSLAAHRRPAPKAKAGRNDPCPCGSGKKYKRCCGG